MKKGFNDFTGGRNLLPTSLIENRDFVIATNVFYNSAKQIQTRRGYREFGNAIDANPITSYFFYQRDDTLARIAICFSGNDAWKYDETTGNRSSIRTGREEYETLTGRTTQRTRRDFTVYKNVIYMGNGVNLYSSYDGTTRTSIGQGAAKSGGSRDHTTDKFLLGAYPITNDDEIMFSTTGTLPTGITPIPGSTTTSRRYYVVNQNGTTDIQISDTPGGTPVSISTNGTGTVSYYELEKPRFRYVQYLSDRIYGAGSDNAPATLYYSNALPTDGSSISTNAIIVGGDESGVISGLDEFSQSIIVMKNTKIYAVDVANTNVEKIDVEGGCLSDRSIQNVANSLAYLSDRGIETLVKRDGVSGSSAIDNRPLSDKIRDLFDSVTEINRYATAGRYIRDTNNYYVAIDGDNNNIPETTVVYSSLTGGRTTYSFPVLYDFGDYINDDGQKQYLFASGTTGQMYEFEYGFDDDGEEIAAQIKTKELTFGEIGSEYTFDYVKIRGRMQAEAGGLDFNIYINGSVISTGSITDTQLNGNIYQSIPIKPVGIEYGDPVNGILVYRFEVTIPFFARGPHIQLELLSSGVQWIYEGITVGVNGEPETVSAYTSII